jgi:type IV secretion system protein VirB1
MFVGKLLAFAAAAASVVLAAAPSDAGTAYMRLSDVAATCGVGVSPRTTLAIIQVESGGAPFAINDNDGKRSYFPPTKDEAVALAASLLEQGHNIDVGVMQVNSGNFAHYHATLGQIFDPCVNVATGTDILLNAYWGRPHRAPSSELSAKGFYDPSEACRLTVQRASDGTLWCRSGGMVDLYGPGQIALYHAFQVYNSNHANGAPRYARSVWMAGIGLARNGL